MDDDDEDFLVPYDYREQQKHVPTTKPHTALDSSPTLEEGEILEEPMSPCYAPPSPRDAYTPPASPTYAPSSYTPPCSPPYDPQHTVCTRPQAHYVPPSRWVELGITPPPFPPLPSAPCPVMPRAKSKHPFVKGPMEEACVLLKCRGPVKNTGPWWEVLLVYNRGANVWGFPGVPAGNDLSLRLTRLGAWHRSSLPGTLCMTVDGRNGAKTHVFVAEVGRRQQPPTQLVSAKANTIWAVESELAFSTPTSAPGRGPHIYQTPVCKHVLRLLQDLPMEFRFASSDPPLVLYHGTSVSAAETILRTGGRLLPTTQSGSAMLGSGVYLARWDKAVSFAQHNADNVTRGEGGAVLRCLVWPSGHTVELDSKWVCACGCSKAFVDHLGLAGGKDADVIKVPDDCGHATKRAEWCVRDPSRLFVRAAVLI